MVTKQQIITTRQKIEDVASTVEKMHQLCIIALYEYVVGGQKKTLPQEDIDALIAEYQNLKTELKTKLSALP